MRTIVVALCLAVLVVFASACSDGYGDDNGEPTVPPTIAATRVPEASPSASTREAVGTSDTTLEVQGVVGAVDARAGIIEVRATGGSTITKIELAQNATITRTGGESIALSDIRPSDRVVATGEPGSDPDTLVAHTVTVQQVVRGGPPGTNPGG